MTNAIAMTANWKKDVQFEKTTKFVRELEENRTVCQDDKKLEGQKIEDIRYPI